MTLVDADNPAMPIFEYACNACGHQFEFLKLPAATTVPSCPACNSPDLKRLLSARPRFNPVCGQRHGRVTAHTAARRYPPSTMHD
jgi:putative FmdB family regulatory protein